MQRHRILAPRQRPSWLVASSCCFAGASAGVAAPEQKPLTNNDVVSMVQAGLPPDVVIEKIRLSKNNAFDISTDALITLKQAGVSGDIIRVMVNPNAESKPVAGGNDNTPAGCQVPPGGQPSWLSGSSPAKCFFLPDKAERSEINYDGVPIDYARGGTVAKSEEATS